MSTAPDTPLLRVLFLINHAGRGGSEKYVYRLIEAYEGKRAQCFFAYNEEGLLAEQLAALQIPSFRLDMRSSFDFKAAKQLAKLCRDNKIDVIHAQHPRENYIAVLSRLYYKTPRVVYTCHLHWDVPAWHKPFNRAITAHNHKIIAVCNSVAKQLVQNGARHDKIQVIYNGISPASRQAPPKGIRESLGIDKNAFVIAMLARYDANKHYDLLTEALGKLKAKTDKPFAALYVGDGELYSEVETQIRALGLEKEIHQLGYRTDTDAILSESNLFINTSASEALSFAILEALSHGLPVVASKVGGNPDILSPQNDCGLLVEFGNTDAMADAICRYMDDDALYARCSQNALRTVSEVFHINKILKDTFDAYQ